MKYFLGLDIGSTLTKAVIFNEQIHGYKIASTGANCSNTVQTIVEDLLNQNNLPESAINYTVATGYGRRLINLADSTISEITANVKGAIWMGKTEKKIQTIINIGGQDCKVIALDERGNAKNFAMNDKCAAGTGRFLEVMSRLLEVNLDEMGEISLSSELPAKINNTCTVFAESEVISLLARGKSKADIIAGIHHSIARRICRMVKRVSTDKEILFDGGPAVNMGLVAALEDELMAEIYVPEFPQITTALGAALLAKDKFQSGGIDGE